MDFERHLYKIDKDRITEVDDTEISRQIDSKIEYWLALKAESRESVVQELKKLGLDSGILSEISVPGNSKTIMISDHSMIINLIIPKPSAWYEGDYITIIMKPGLMITILKPEFSLFDGLEEVLNLNPPVEGFSIFYLIYYMISIVLIYSTGCVTKARELTNELSVKIDDDPESIDLADIISAKQHGQKLSSIVEDQNITLKLIPRINWSDKEEKIDEEIRSVIDHFGFLSISVNHLEDKIRELQLQYQLILQEKGNKRLNALTIIQAIFVPLTLIAGIYGMNFIFMPELKWTYGYFWVLGLMVLIAVGELWWFKKKGWFD